MENGVIPAKAGIHILAYARIYGILVHSVHRTQPHFWLPCSCVGTCELLWNGCCRKDGAAFPRGSVGTRKQKRHNMILDNKPGITDQVELARAEEEISKQKALQLFDSGDIAKTEVGTFKGLSFIHACLFEDIYPFAGKIREVKIAKGNFRFAPLMYLSQSLEHINKMPQGNFDEIVEKYVEMNVAHPFREGNGRATRIWLDLIFKTEIKRVVDWNLIDKEDYHSAMQRSVVKDVEIKSLLKAALTDRIDDRVLFMKGIDVSYYYEGYSQFKTGEL